MNIKKISFRTKITVLNYSQILALEKNELIFAIESSFVKRFHINNKTNPWFYKIDDEFVYYRLTTDKSMDKDFYKKQVTIMKDSISNQNLKDKKITRLKNGIKCLENEFTK